MQTGLTSPPMVNNPEVIPTPVPTRSAIKTSACVFSKKAAISLSLEMMCCRSLKSSSVILPHSSSCFSSLGRLHRVSSKSE